MIEFIVIGITDNPTPFFPTEVLEVIQQGKIFSGGKRHHEIVAPLLPDGALWIDITVPLSKVFEQYQQSTLNCQLSTVIVFASGDPLFFGFANTLQREFPHSPMTVFPSFNSLQLLSHRLLLPYHDMRIVSLTGRPWKEFDRALIEGTTKMGVLTDKEHTPATIAQRMLDYGYVDYTMSVGEHLGNPVDEKVTTGTLTEMSERHFSMPNCLILTGSHPHQWGIPESDFALLDGRSKMITKMPIRLLSLQALDLPRRHSLWDVGFCTGSVSIEARLQFPHLDITAFEVRPEGATLMNENSRRFGVPGIQTVIGDFLTVNCNDLPHPDAVFIGGHGGQLKAIMAKVIRYLLPHGCIVMNSVTPQSRQLFDEACQELGLKEAAPTHIQLNEHNPIDILKCELPSSTSLTQA